MSTITSDVRPVRRRLINIHVAVFFHASGLRVPGLMTCSMCAGLHEGWMYFFRLSTNKKKGGMSVICVSQEPFIWSASRLVGLLLRTPRNLNKRGKGVITSANLALVPACGDASQHISVVWLQMNECLQKMKVHNPESRLTTELFIDVLFLPWFRSEVTSIRSVIAVLSAVFGWTCLVQSQHYHPNQSISQSLKCAPHFLAFLHQKS